MTKRESLELIIPMWDWLAANPEANKNDFLARHPDYPQGMESSCACCEYDTEQNRKRAEGVLTGDCRFCPLQSLWGLNCTSSLSPYMKWSLDESPAGAVHAKTIADAARVELAKLEGRDE